jgi:hypothetical protein
VVVSIIPGGAGCQQANRECMLIRIVVQSRVVVLLGIAGQLRIGTVTNTGQDSGSSRPAAGPGSPLQWRPGGHHFRCVCAEPVEANPGAVVSETSDLPPIPMFRKNPLHYITLPFLRLQ